MFRFTLIEWSIQFSSLVVVVTIFSIIIRQQNTYNTNSINNACPGYCKHVLCWIPPEKSLILSSWRHTDRYPICVHWGMVAPFKIKYHVSIHMHTVSPTNLCMVKSPLHMSLFRVYIRFQQSLNIWFDDAEILTDVACHSHVVFSPCSIAMHNENRERKSQLMTEKMDYVIILEIIKIIHCVHDDVIQWKSRQIWGIW